LRDGVFETTSNSSSSVTAQQFMNWVRSHHSERSSSSVDGGISIPVIGSLNGSESQYKQLESDYAASQSGSSEASQRLAVHIKSVSSALATQFVNCMALKGLHVWLELTDDPHVFKVAAQFNSPGRQQQTASIDKVDIVPTNVSCDGFIARNTVVDGSTKRMRCTRVGDAPVEVTINASTDPLGGGTLVLSRLARPLPESERRCESTVLISRGAEATHPRLTDGDIGPGRPGVNSGAPGASYYVAFPRPEWIHHVVLYPLQNGAPTLETNTIHVTYNDGSERDVESAQQSATTLPFTIYIDPGKGKGARKVTVNTVPVNGRDWIAWSEIEVFACR
jgi:hypothetical protein